MDPFADQTPIILEALICHIETRGVKCKDLFERSADVDYEREMTELYERLSDCQELPVLGRDVDPHASVALLDRELPSLVRQPLVPYEMYSLVSRVMAMSTTKQRVSALRLALSTLPVGSFVLLKRLSCCMWKLRRKAKVPCELLADTFGYTLLRLRHQVDITDICRAFVELLSGNYRELFPRKLPPGGAAAKKRSAREIDLKFIEALNNCCGAVGTALLSQAAAASSPAAAAAAAAHSSQHVMMMMRSSRKTVQWNDVMQPSKGRTGTALPAGSAQPPRVTKEGAALGKLLFDVKRNAARQYYMKKLVQLRGASEVTSSEDVRSYEGAKNAGGRPHGRGVMQFNNGDEYSGEFVDGVRQGEGKLVMEDGSVYEGQFANNKFEGRGGIRYENGDTFAGDFHNDLFHGNGCYTAAGNATRYEGGFRDGMREGQGQFLTSAGGSYFGEYQRDLMHGLGIYTYPNGDEYKGEFSEGVPNGQGQYTFEDGGDPLVGTFKNGQFIG